MDDLLATERYGKALDNSAIIVTAIPAGRKWRLKARGPKGSVELPVIFSNRLEALGGAVLLAGQCGGQVIP